MKPQEYVTIYTVEDWHWWYTGLRDVLKHHWNIYVSHGKIDLADVGCGTGGNMAFIETEGRAYGLDRSPEAIAFCRQRGLTKTIVASADQIPYPNEMFEAVLSLDVLSHRWVQNKQDALNEMARILKPGGYLFLNLPAYQWLHSSHDVAVEQDWRATASQVRQMLTVSGLEIDRVTYWNTLLFPAFALLRLMRKRKKGNPSSSDLGPTKKTGLDFICTMFLRLERYLMRRIDLPFGLSVFAVAHKSLRE